MARAEEQFEDLPALERAYRRSLFTLLGHAAFFAVCCIIAVILRRLFKLPPALLTVAFGVAVLLFGGDVLRFLAHRRRLRQRRHALLQ